MRLYRYQNAPIFDADRISFQWNFGRFCHWRTRFDAEFCAMQGTLHPVTVQTTEVKRGIFVGTHIIHRVELARDVAHENALAIACIDTLNLSGLDFVYTASIESGVVHECS